jgi:2'-5' RNA ligase
MKYFVGIVPPQHIYSTVERIQHAYGDNRLEPHITLRPPVAPTDINSWIDQIRNVAATFPPFNISLPGTGNFGKRVLFIKVESTELNRLEKQLVESIKEFEPVTKDDNRGYHPHLTLGRSWCGFTKDDFSKMKELADDYLSKETVSFQAEFLRVYHKPGHIKRYETLIDLSLGG